MAFKSQLRTADTRARQGWMIKPSELIEIVELQPLTLSDRRTFDLLISRAWRSIRDDVWHEAAPADLRVARDQNDRLKDTVYRLRGAFINVLTQHIDERGDVVDRVVENIPLLFESRWSLRRHGLLYYKFHPKMRNIIADSRTWAKLNETVIRSMSSKYSLILYEMIQDRSTLVRRTHEDFTLDEIRASLGVPPGRLSNYPNLRLRALAPAAQEVSEKSRFKVAFHPLTKPGSKAVTGVSLHWWPKPHNLELDVRTPQEALN